MNGEIPVWPPMIPYATFRGRCKEAGLEHDTETFGGTRSAFLDTASYRLTVHHRGTGGGHGGRRPVEVTSVRVRTKPSRGEAVIDGAPPKARGFDTLDTGVQREVVAALRVLFAPVRGVASSLSKGTHARVRDGEHRGATGTIQWIGKRGKPELMASLKTSDGRALFMPARVLEAVDGGPRPMVKGARVKVVKGEGAGALAEITWVDPEGTSERIEVRFLPPKFGSAWVTRADVELDV